MYRPFGLARILVVSMILGGCVEQETSGVNASRKAVTDRRWRISDFDTLWSVGGPTNDSILGYPSDVRVVGNVAVISDPGFHRVIALSVADGRTLWTSTGREPGGIEFIRPLRLTPLPDGGVAVVDDRSRHLIELDANGRSQHATPLGRSQSVNGICAIAGRGYLISGTGSRGPLVALTRDTMDAHPVHLPFPEDSTLGQLALQAQVAGDPQGKLCAVAHAFGRGVALWDGSHFIATSPYVEAMRMPELTKIVQKRVSRDSAVEIRDLTLPASSRVAALDVAVLGNRVRVLFEGQSVIHGRIVDDYDARTLSYIGSVRLPVAARAIAVADSNVMIVLTERQSYPIAMALRERVRAQ